MDHFKVSLHIIERKSGLRKKPKQIKWRIFVPLMRHEIYCLISLLETMIDGDKIKLLTCIIGVSKSWVLVETSRIRYLNIFYIDYICTFTLFWVFLWQKYMTNLQIIVLESIQFHVFSGLHRSVCTFLFLLQNIFMVKIDKF